jgi:hypothetical protein
MKSRCHKPLGQSKPGDTTTGAHQTLITVASCKSLVEADLIVSRLHAAEIPAFLPDESLTVAAWAPVDKFGAIRIQVPTRFLDSATLLLTSLVNEQSA